MASLGQLTLDSSYDDVAEAIVLECARRGYSWDETVGVVADGVQESRLNPRARNPAGPWDGIYQQDGSYPGRFNPNTQIGAFLDRLDVKRAHSGHGDIWLNIFWLQQRPSEPSAAQAYANGRKAYLAEIKSRSAEATRLVNLYWPNNGGQPVPDNRPDFNEINEIGLDNGNHASVRSRQPINFFLHTQEGDGNATDLSAYLRSTSGSSAVSYHYTIHQAVDGGVTVVDVVDTDLYSWSVLNANVFSINLCFAGSRAAWTRDQWMKQSKAIRVAAYLAVQDAVKYGFSTEVVLPPYSSARAGISDHRYVTKCLGIGNHTDVGGPLAAPWSGFPWDYFVQCVNEFTNNAPVVTQPAPQTPVPVSQWPKSATDRELLEWLVNQLGDGHPDWKSKGMTARDKLWAVADKLGV